MHPEKAFQRALSSHICGVEGRLPFTAAEETAILAVVRRKEKWPCFEGDDSARFGLNGFRGQGFHESSQLGAAAAGAVPAVDDESNPPPAKKSRRTSKATPELISSRMASIAPKMRDDSEPRDVLTSGSTIYARFQVSVLMMLNKFELLGLDAWESIITFGKYSILALDQGYCTPGDETRIKAHFDECCLRNPGESVIVVDALTHSLRNRILFQNAASELTLGRISRDTELGCTRKLFDARDNWAAFSAAMRSFIYDQEVELIYRVHYVNGETLWARTWIKVIPSDKVTVLHGFTPLQQVPNHREG
jgi:hypothetical protein